ncbi:hypothetical protein MTR67_011086 [Solanum verrucosum]|uniref:Sialyltransferase-like protein 1 n=1 Tax=Solanum verrucosum TaxID=315347 RepID=A0AAF0Q6B7_SOLVR|nr:hypothetical protein MTR67_011086 [Solanum verrucosum]
MTRPRLSRKPALVRLLSVAAVFSIIILIAIQSSFFTGSWTPVNLDIPILSHFQSNLQQCVANRGLGLTAHIIDHCNVILKFPQGTNSTWYNEQFKIFEPLEYKYDVCEAILLWEQYRNMTTVLTREYLDSRPDGWFDYAAKRIAQLGADKCYNQTLCEEHLNLTLPANPPFHPRQFRRCAVVGNSGDLLKTQFGEEIDSHDAVIRDNEAPVNEARKGAKHVPNTSSYWTVQEQVINRFQILVTSVTSVNQQKCFPLGPSNQFPWSRIQHLILLADLPVTVLDCEYTLTAPTHVVVIPILSNCGVFVLSNVEDARIDIHECCVFKPFILPKLMCTPLPGISFHAILKYAKHVGLKRDFRLVVRGAAGNMIKILNGSDDEVLIIKSVIHRDFNAMIKKIRNPVYLFQGIVLRRGAKGTGMKSIELALSMCDIVDIYGFTVDPGYTEWTRYFSTPRKGHNPLQGRAYYQLLECLGVIRIHSPMRAKRKQDWSDVPSREMINNAHRAALRLKKKQAGEVGGLGQFVNCKVWGKSGPYGTGPVSGSTDMTDTRKDSNYNRWEIMPFESLRKEARKHYMQMEGVSLYKMDGNKLDDLVCVKHPLKSEA